MPTGMKFMRSLVVSALVLGFARAQEDGEDGEDSPKKSKRDIVGVRTPNMQPVLLPPA